MYLGIRAYSGTLRVLAVLQGVRKVVIRSWCLFEFFSLAGLCWILLEEYSNPWIKETGRLGDKPGALGHVSSSNMSLTATVLPPIYLFQKPLFSSSSATLRQRIFYFASQDPMSLLVTLLVSGDNW